MRRVCGARSVRVGQGPKWGTPSRIQASRWRISAVWKRSWAIARHHLPRRPTLRRRLPRSDAIEDPATILRCQPCQRVTQTCPLDGQILELVWRIVSSATITQSSPIVELRARDLRDDLAARTNAGTPWIDACHRGRRRSPVEHFVGQALERPKQVAPGAIQEVQRFPSITVV
jgi:hypothetical protein